MHDTTQGANTDDKLIFGVGTIRKGEIGNKLSHPEEQFTVQKTDCF
jgi:hypothetical protein